MKSLVLLWVNIKKGSSYMNTFAKHCEKTFLIYSSSINQNILHFSCLLLKINHSNTQEYVYFQTLFLSSYIFHWIRHMWFSSVFQIKKKLSWDVFENSAPAIHIPSQRYFQLQCLKTKTESKAVSQSRKLCYWFNSVILQWSCLEWSTFSHK